jgi:outer membrane protein assembly factor BamB
MTKTIINSSFVLHLILSCVGNVSAGDWPMWRYDAGRTASTPDSLPAELRMRWVHEFPSPDPAWPEEPRLDFDSVYEPVVKGKTLFVCLSRNDKLVAVDTETGQQKWAFHADGPMRFAPVAWKDRVIAVSDDGSLYCLDAVDGRVCWTFRGAASDQRVLGNGRLISTWPARGGPVLADGTIYFACGIWPFMGVFIHAIDAESGEPIWINDGSGAQYAPHPHGASAFGGVAPQGYLAVANDVLIVPSGRSRPAGVNRHTGELLYFDTGWKGGNCRVAGMGPYFLNGSYLFEAATGQLGFNLSTGRRDAWDARLVLADKTGYTAEQNALFAYDLSNIQFPANVSDKRKHDYEYRQFEGRVLKPKRLDVAADVVWIKAGSRLYTSRGRTVTTVELPEGLPSWTTDVEGSIGSMIAADRKLFVTTREGRLYCYADTESSHVGRTTSRTPTDGSSRAIARTRKPAMKRPAVDPLSVPPTDHWAHRAEQILSATAVNEGYCLVWGLESGRLLEELVRRSQFQVVGVDTDERRVAALRRKLDALKLYGRRAAVHVGSPSSFPFPPYLANLIVSENIERAGLNEADFLPRIFAPLRPYGGVACLEVPPERRPALLDRIKAARLPGGEARTFHDYCLLTRRGPLPGAIDWTHQGADSGNSRASMDQRVKLPMGVLWFGGPAGGDQFWDRHAGAPRPQVAGGRLIAAGPGTLHAVDAYTGRILWKRNLPGFGNPIPKNQGSDHVYSPRAAFLLGGHYVSLEDGIYVRLGRKCLRLDPANGATMSTFELPDDAVWGFITVWKNLLVAGASPLAISDLEDAKKPGYQQIFKPGKHPWNQTSSQRLVVMDRITGKVLWKRNAAHGFRHSAIVVGNGRVFCIDRLPLDVVAKMKRRGDSPSEDPVLIAIDARSGRTIWRTTKDVTGSWLAYSEGHDCLVQGLDRLTAGGDYKAAFKMVVYRGEDGAVQWAKPQTVGAAACMLRGDEIILGYRGLDLQTGETRWSGFSRTKGCDVPLAAADLLLFRSSMAGYLDLKNHSGTGNWGGFRSACNGSLIAANGVLCAVKSAQGCDCNVPNQTSLALVHMPNVEIWSHGGRRSKGQNIGINLGAPGDRLSDDGTFWIDFPSVGGRSPDVPVSITPENPHWFRRHSSWIQGETLPWVAASGVEGLRKITITPDGKTEAATVRLYFLEIANSEPGARVFSISIQGREVLPDFDIVHSAGRPFRVVTREFKNITIDEELSIVLEPCGPSMSAEPILCGVEMILDSTDQSGIQKP